MDRRHHARHLAAERARVHHQPAADRPGNPFAKFESRQPVLDRRLAPSRRIALLPRHSVHDHRSSYAAKPLAELDHQPAHAAIAHQEIGSGAEAESREFRGDAPPPSRPSIRLALHRDKQIGRTADLKGRQRGQRIARLQTLAESARNSCSSALIGLHRGRAVSPSSARTRSPSLINVARAKRHDHVARASNHARQPPPGQPLRPGNARSDGHARATLHTAAATSHPPSALRPPHRPPTR